MEKNGPFYGGGMVKAMHDNVNHPKHYTGFSNGSEVIDITENCTFNTGNAIKYAARAGRTDGNVKGNIVEDLNKAKWYIEREIERLKAGSPSGTDADSEYSIAWLDSLPSGIEVRTRKALISFIKLRDGYWVSKGDGGGEEVFTSAEVNRRLSALGEGITIRRLN